MNTSAVGGISSLTGSIAASKFGISATVAPYGSSSTSICSSPPKRFPAVKIGIAGSGSDLSAVNSGIIGPGSDLSAVNSGIIGPGSGFSAVNSGIIGPGSGLSAVNSGIIGPGSDLSAVNSGIIGPGCELPAAKGSSFFGSSSSRSAPGLKKDAISSKDPS